MHRRLFPVGCLLIFALLCLGAALQESATFDEGIHITSGYAFWKTGSYQVEPLHPPVLRLWMSLPLLAMPLTFPTSHPFWTQGMFFDFSNLFLYQPTRWPPDMLLQCSRGMVILLGIALGYLLWRWAREAIGLAAANATLVAYAFCPTLIAHAHLATLDLGVALFSTLALYSLWHFLRRPEWPWAAVLGISFALAYLTKFSGILILPIAVFTGLAAWRLEGMAPSLSAKRLATYSLIFLSAAGLMTLLAYGVVEIPRLVEGLRMAGEQSHRGHSAFFLGDYSQQGWRSYYLVAFLLKTPIPFLAMLLLGFLLAGRHRSPAMRFGMVWGLSPAVAYIALGSFSHFQIGIRYLLGVYPLLCLWVGTAASDLLSRGKPWRWVALGLALWYGGETVLLFPRYISYFNPIAGGPAGGHRYLLDSNLDWGQGLKALGRYLKKEKIESVYLCYFGTADPHTYGIRYKPVSIFSNAHLDGDPDRNPEKESKVLLVISATNRAGVYYEPHDVFRWTEKRQPAAVLMDSLWVYDITSDAELRRYLND